MVSNHCDCHKVTWNAEDYSKRMTLQEWSVSCFSLLIAADDWDGAGKP